MSNNAEATYNISADEIADVLPVYHFSKRVPLFVGKPGIAKTAFVRLGAEQISKRLGGAHVEVRELHLASMSEVDVRGYLIPQGDRAQFTKPEFWAAVEQHPNGILFLDEFVQATHEVQKAVAPLILEGRVGEYTLPAGWSVACAGNGLDDGAGANSLLSHIINRVSIINTRAPDVDLWTTWATTLPEPLPFELCAFAKLRPNLVFDAELPSGADTPYCTPRSLHALGDIANKYPGGLRAMIEQKVGMAMMTGVIGAGAASELSAVVKTAVNLPKYEDVLKNPEGTEIPTKPDMAYAMVMLLACRAKVDDAVPVTQYLVRFKPNYAVTGIASLLRRDRQFAAAKPVLKWVLENQEMLKKFNTYLSQMVGQG